MGVSMTCISRNGCAWPNLCEANGYCMAPTASKVPQSSKDESLPPRPKYGYTGEYTRGPLMAPKQGWVLSGRAVSEREALHAFEVYASALERRAGETPAPKFKVGDKVVIEGGCAERTVIEVLPLIVRYRVTMAHSDNEFVTLDERALKPLHPKTPLTGDIRNTIAKEPQ